MNLLALRPHPFVCAIGISQHRLHDFDSLDKEFVSRGDIIGLNQLRTGTVFGLEGLGRHHQQYR